MAVNIAIIRMRIAALALETRQENVNGNASAKPKEVLIVGVVVCARLNQHAKFERCRCSICGYLEVVPLYDTNNFCGNCGAKMDGKEE